MNRYIFELSAFMSEQHVVRWYIPGRVIYIGWANTVTIQELGAVSDQVGALMDEATSPIIILNDARLVRHHPQHPLQVRHTMAFLDHPNMGFLTSVTGNAVMRFLATVVPQMISFTDNRVYGRMDEALLHMHQLRLDVPLDWGRADASVMVKPIELDQSVYPQVTTA